ncbi:MAG: hypothetical protein P8N76_26070 [Pirellulaceae bacterium]|nr:hypothetical protein [Pirellulaceae bacterium]
MSENPELNRQSDSHDAAEHNSVSQIPEQSRRELLGKLRKAAIAVPIATALALKTETAFPY